MARKTENSQTILVGPHEIVISRRFLPSRSLRVRVTTKGLISGEIIWSDFRDYSDMHEGDATYARHISTFEKLARDRADEIIRKSSGRSL